MAVWTDHESKQPQPDAFLERVRDKSTVLFVAKSFGSGVVADIRVTGFSLRLSG